MALKFLKTPAPVAVLLPDTQFFVRAVPVPDAQTAADVAAQVELALEGLAPFPLGQMYYGCHWIPGARHALAYAAYRKRFSASSVETWPAADVVLPAFTAFITPAARPATTVLLNAPASVTAIHWNDASGVPAQVLSRELPQAAPDEPPVSAEDMAAARAAARAELLRATPGTAHLAEYTVPENLAPARAANGGLSFTASAQTPPNAAPAAPQTVTYNREQLDALDVRDKAEIAVRRARRRRDLVLWRAFVGCLVLMLLCALAELAFVFGGFAQEKRMTQVTLQAPAVAGIERDGALATRIEGLSSQRLLPFEMIDLMRPSLPPSVLFTRIATRGLNSIEIQGKTSVAADFTSFRNALMKQPNILHADLGPGSPSIRDGSTTFTLIVTFKNGAVKPAVDEPPPKPPETAAPDSSAQAGDSSAADDASPDQIQQQPAPDQQPATPAGDSAQPQQPAATPDENQTSGSTSTTAAQPRATASKNGTAN